MSKVFINEETLTNIGNAIREKTGKNNLISPGSMPEEIRSITGGGSGDSDESKAQLDAMIERTITSYSNPTLSKLRDYTFYQCSQLNSINCPNLKSIGKYSLAETNLIEADFPLLEEIGESGLAGKSSTSSSSLTAVNLPLLQKIDSYAFRYNNQITSITLPSLKQTASTPRVFEECSNLTRLDLGPIEQIYTNWFTDDTNLTVLILRGSTMASLSKVNAFTNTPIQAGTGHIYVPKDLIDSYKTATNWTTFASQFRAIEDYPDICGEV